MKTRDLSEEKQKKNASLKHDQGGRVADLHHLQCWVQWPLGFVSIRKEHEDMNTLTALLAMGPIILSGTMGADGDTEYTNRGGTDRPSRIERATVWEERRADRGLDRNRNRHR